MKTLTKEQVEQKFGDNDDTLLINVLPREKFLKEHIPGSINIDANASDFIRQFEKKAADKNQMVIVYCAGFDCEASTKAAEKLERAGYKKVFDFKGGLEEWREKGGKTRSLRPTARKSAGKDQNAGF